MRRIWHPYTDWEEYHFGMWREISRAEHDEMLPKAIEFTGDCNRYGSAMLRVIDEWPISCEHNLTDVGQNRKAWLGHAATCLAIGVPEYVTREAWGHLTQEQQDCANSKALQAIRSWFDKQQRLI